MPTSSQTRSNTLAGLEQATRSRKRPQSTVYECSSSNIIEYNLIILAITGAIYTNSVELISSNRHWLYSSYSSCIFMVFMQVHYNGSVFCLAHQSLAKCSGGFHEVQGSCALETPFCRWTRHKVRSGGWVTGCGKPAIEMAKHVASIYFYRGAMGSLFSRQIQFHGCVFRGHPFEEYFCGMNRWTKKYRFGRKLKEQQR